MLSKSSRRASAILSVALIATATVSIAPQSAIAAHARYLHHTYPHHHGTWLARRATLPHGPEYGFVRHSPLTPCGVRVTRLSWTSAYLASLATCRQALTQTSIETFSRANASFTLIASTRAQRRSRDFQ